MNLKISNRQLFWIMLTMELSMTIARLNSTIHYSAQDAWISLCIGGIGGITILLLTWAVTMQHPTRTLIEYSQSLMGSWIGHVIGLLYLVFWFSVAGAILRVGCDFVLTGLFSNTPLIVVSILLLVPALYVTYSGGIEGIARCSQLLGPLIGTMFLMTIVLNVQNIDLHRLLPIMADTSPVHLFQGALVPLSLFGECTMIVMLVPFVSNPREALSSLCLALVLSIVIAACAVIAIIGTFGPQIPAKMVFPIYDMIKFISSMDFIQNVDVITIPLWLFSVFIKLSLYLFISSYGAAQWVGIKRWRILVFPISAVVIAFSLLPRNTVEVVMYTYKITVPYATSILFIIIPLMLLIVGAFRGQTNMTFRSSVEAVPPNMAVIVTKLGIIGIMITLFGYWWMTGLHSPLDHMIPSD